MLASLTNQQMIEVLYVALKRKDEEQFFLLFDKMQRWQQYYGFKFDYILKPTFSLTR